ncbi:Alkaline phosphatase [Catenovulum agarivorans DS-2]|uniref:Alkaline phosphatase n=1 Tax=Catenovulum agarivorans DS-2 TaxID=1328313 RepID=W7QT45_9ALTE|nr:alkaline phosphatase [Catenovulum agarivorans]EWH12197.1 Alkaline phosphatase [Catenovulum agarivorans DS-2]
MRLIHYTLIGILIGLFALSMYKSDNPPPPKNIILVIGDGMGDNYLSAYRYWKAQSANNVSPTIFDQLLVGKSMSYPDDDTFVTDSAAGATAFAAAQKSYNGAISVNNAGERLATILEQAKKLNKTTAIVATSEVVHATPATFYAHQKHRKDYPQIADQIVDNQINNRPIIDLLLGGGLSYLAREDRNILQELEAFDYQVKTQWAELNSITRLPAIGVFANKGLQYEINSRQQRLLNMTKLALQRLETDANSRKNGFFMMVEASQIDWCGHANDIACAMHEMQDLESTLAILKSFVDDNPDTLLVVTADHETGGLSVGADGHYNWKPQLISNINLSIDKLAEALVESEPDEIYQVWLQHTQLELNFAQIEVLKRLHQKDLAALARFSRQTINRMSLTGWTSGGHTAADVPVLAYGAGANQFAGFNDNAEIGKILLTILNTND